MKHTPGPWEANAGRVTRFVPELEGGPVTETVAICSGDCEGSPIANARLIAAAPELKAACEANVELHIHASECTECDIDGQCAEGERLLKRALDLRDAALALVRGEGDE